MTTNHPAHGPVSLDRLHQISEILSKAAIQSDGGNLGYAMADAVKVIDEVMNAEPVAYMTYKGYLLHAADPKLAEYSDPTPLYDAPPAAIVPDEMVNNIDNPYGDEDLIYEQGKIEGWNACRAAMLQAGNSPVAHDGWKLVPVIAFPSQWAAGKKAFDSAGINKIDAVYKAMVAAAPQQEVNRG
ncbi:hypothetical protein [Citrobacter werkmanii]|uniref:hypothetical protein n=1 Tax=Citrobacter werkmanii TaxID=67827 RepID=UPI00133101A9|nr:hypothetical protein [Citrobacter werkmanii]